MSADPAKRLSRISSIYNPDILASIIALMKPVCTKKAVSVFLSIVLGAVGILAWWHLTTPKPWSDERMVEGAIYSIVAGKISGGREIVVAGGFVRGNEGKFSRVICCYDAENGQILWENNKTGYTDLGGLQVNVALDGNGEVIVTSHNSNSDQSGVATLEKLAGTTGDQLWVNDILVFRRASGTGYPTTNFIVTPSIDHFGNIWLIQPSSAGNRVQSHLCLFDARNGALVSRYHLTESEHRNLPSEVICLKGGGAIVFAFGSDMQQQYAFRFSNAGKLLHRFPVDFTTGSSSSLELRRYVDEEHHRIMVSVERWQDGYSKWGSSVVQTAAFSMESGSKLWESSSTLVGAWGHSEGCLSELAVLQPNGDLEYRQETQVAKKRLDWGHWKMVNGIPLPSSVIKHEKRLVRSLVSGSDGLVGKPEPVSGLNNWFEAQEKESGTTTKEIYKKGFLEFHSLGRIRCRDARRWLAADNRIDAGGKMLCFRVVRSPSGRVILSRDPNDRDFESQFMNWQIKAL